MLPLPGESFEVRRIAQTRANSLSLVRFDTNDYSVPVAWAHHELTVKGGIEEVRITERDQLVCAHARIWERQQASFDPLDDLALLERKPGAFDSARPLADWGLPDCFALLRRRLEASLGYQGTREYIRCCACWNAVACRGHQGGDDGRRDRHHGSHAIALIVAQRAERAVTLFALDGRPHLQAFALEPPDLAAYAALKAQGSLMKQLESTSMVLLRHHLKALRLPTITAECEKLARQAAADNADHLTYLCSHRARAPGARAQGRRAALKGGPLPDHKTLEGFDFAARSSVNKLLVCELARCEYIDRRENVLFVGNPGTGKTHLATALAMAACGRGYRVRFFRLTELATLLMEARDERSLLGLKSRLAKLDLLVLDELGYVPASKVGAELLFDVISSAYERTSLIVTTNLPFESWTEVLGSERLTGAALDRLTHRCQIIETKGESYRLRDARARIRRPPDNEQADPGDQREALEGGQTSS